MQKLKIKLPSFKGIKERIASRKDKAGDKALKSFLDIFLAMAPFLLMDLFIKNLAIAVRFDHIAIIKSSTLFTASWTLLIVFISKSIKGIAGKIFYGICFSVFFVVFIAQTVYFQYTGFFFDFSLLQSADEGKGYVWEVVKNIDATAYLQVAIVLALGIFCMVKIPRTENNDWRKLALTVLVFAVVYINIPTTLGKANTELEWDTWRNPRNIYDSFSDANKSMKICGLYEFVVRDFYVSYIREEDEGNEEEEKIVREIYATETVHKTNDYTGIFEGKNVIFVQLEGMDSWLVSEEGTPNICSMMDNSIVFNNHYSYYTGGGSTFNSELAVTTGFMTPVSYTKNPYSFSTNYLPYSLPRMLKGAGYSPNAFHMNTGEYYSRDINYRNWGYENYYSLLDDGKYSDKSYQLDRELILNELFYEKMFKQKEPFMHYIITYTNHTPFTLNCSNGKFISKEIFPEGEEIPELGEEDVARLFAAETDRMMGLLLQALEDNDLIDNTVIVAYADHYLYTLNDKTILDKYKETENNLINRTPFFIWSKGMEPEQIEKVNSQIDILPTVLNMLGIEFEEEWYVGRDIMDPEYSGYVFFSDYSWYDGTNYVENGVVTNDVEADPKYIEETNGHINLLIQKNDLTLKYDFFKKRK